MLLNKASSRCDGNTLNGNEVQIFMKNGKTSEFSCVCMFDIVSGQN